MVERLKYIWMDGELVDWNQAKVHILTHSLHYGCAAFEGIRSYETHDGRAAIFRLKEHIQRLFCSSRIIQLEIPYTFDEIIEACKQTLQVNQLKAGYIRPIVYIGEGVMGVHPKDNPVRVAIAVWKWGAYLGEEALTKGVRAKISSFNRYQVNSIMTKAKLTGNYTTSVLAKREAVSLGADEAIMLDTEGYVAEGTGENIFIVRQGIIKTTPLTSILPGITRDTVMRIAGDLGYQVIEDRFSRDELYISEEAFFTGTAAEITPIREVDARVIGEGRPGPVTKSLQEKFFKVTSGRDPAYSQWLTYYEPVATRV
jgi:branched-chain amino acid aminotransferase